VKDISATVLVMLTLFCTGCSLHSIPEQYVIQKEGDSIVIGQLILPTTGVPYLERPSRGTGGSFSFSTIMGRSSRVYFVVPDQNGVVCPFYIAVPQGRYSIDRISWGEFTSDVKGIFTVYEPGKVYYIGSIQMTVPVRDPGQIAAGIVMDIFANRRSVPVNYRVIDDLTQVTAEFHRKYPHLPLAIEKSLVVFKDPYQ
jgi:hypothetical protein